MSKGLTFFLFDLFISIMMGFGGLISGGSGGGGVASVVADIAPHSSNMISGAFAPLPLLSTPPIPSSMHSSSTLTLSTVCLISLSFSLRVFLHDSWFTSVFILILIVILCVVFLVFM